MFFFDLGWRCGQGSLYSTVEERSLVLKERGASQTARSSPSAVNFEGKTETSMSHWIPYNSLGKFSPCETLWDKAPHNHMQEPPLCPERPVLHGPNLPSLSSSEQWLRSRIVTITIPQSGARKAKSPSHFKDDHSMQSSYLLGLLAKIKCSICSNQLNLWFSMHSIVWDYSNFLAELWHTGACT